MIVDAESKAFGGHLLIDIFQDVSRGISRDIRHTQDSSKTDSSIQIVFGLDSRRVIGNALDARVVNFAAETFEPFDRRLTEIHKLAARHLNLVDLKGL